VLLVLDPSRAVPLAEEIAAAPVFLVEAFRVRVLERVHAGRHVLARRVEHEVEVVAHRAAGVDAPAMTGGNDREQTPELVVVGVVAEEVFRAGCVAGDVVEPVREARSQWSRHVFDGSRRPVTCLCHFRANSVTTASGRPYPNGSERRCTR